VIIAVPGAQVQGVKVSTLPPNGVPNEKALTPKGAMKVKIMTKTNILKK